MCNVAHPALDHVEHVQCESSYRALQLTRVGNDVGGFARLHLRHGNHGRIDRALVAGDDGLKGLNHLTRHRNRIDAVVRHCRVRAFALDGDLEFVAGARRQVLR